jgi:hypothetical protein
VVVVAGLALAGAQALAQGGSSSGGSGGSGMTSGGSATAQPGQPQASANPNEVSGRVALVDATNHELAIDSGTATTQVKVAPDAKITIDGKSASFKDIKQGASVRASLDRAGDGSAKTIEVTSGRKSK